jgi:hypothetical protein
VSHFNVIHFSCHASAKRADAALKASKKEWEGAALRNNETLCNNLLPLRTPRLSDAEYMRGCDAFYSNLQAVGRTDGARVHLLTHDIAMLMGRFATSTSFSADAHGGGRESNMNLLPFLVQMARSLLSIASGGQRAVYQAALHSVLLRLSPAYASQVTEPTPLGRNATAAMLQDRAPQDRAPPVGTSPGRQEGEGAASGGGRRTRVTPPTTPSRRGGTGGSARVSSGEVGMPTPTLVISIPGTGGEERSARYGSLDASPGSSGRPPSGPSSAPGVSQSKHSICVPARASEEHGAPFILVLALLLLPPATWRKHRRAFLQVSGNEMPQKDDQSDGGVI